METKINIAEILKNKPQGTKLYDLLYNIDVELDTISTTDTETVVWCTNETDNNTTCHRGYSEFGTVRGCFDGLQILLPSKEMRDWGKFTWKKGDVLVGEGKRVIFEKFIDENYTEFQGKYAISTYEDITLTIDRSYYTSDFSKIKDIVNVRNYFEELEEKLGGKLNRDTLEIEKPEFKDGDIIYAESNAYHYPSIHILNINGDTKCYYARLVINGRYDEAVDYDIPAFDEDNPNRLRYAIEAEKQQLFSALAKEGKVWDAEKKAIVDLKPKVEFKPFDRCIWKIRNYEGSIWQASFVSYVDEYGATPMGMSVDEDLVNLIILPYNEETAHLLGTTDEWKGGEQ